MRLLRKPFDLVLWFLAVLSLATIFLAHENSFARDVFCSAIKMCPAVENAAAWNKIAYDFAMGALVSLFFYALIIRLPENQKRRRYKRSLTQRYKMFKEDCIGLMLATADGTYDGSFPEQLLDQKRFRDYFKESVTSSQDRWARFCNNLDAYHLKELVKQFEMFRDEISFILNNVDIPSDQPFEFLKRLSVAIYAAHDTTLDYDETKGFARFLWEIFSGWNFVTGYHERDIIQDMIDAI